MKLAIFDFDGTIADTSEGIIDSHRFALEHMRAEVPTEGELRSVIGGNLLKTYIEKFGFNECDARKAVSVYRERYARVGIHKAFLYPGFEELLIRLKDHGFLIGVATLKAETFAKTMLEEMGIARCFDEVCGMDPDDGLDKAGIIEKCIRLCRCEKENTVLIGDSSSDLNGARETGIHFIGVTYGFGFRKTEQYDFITVDHPLEIGEILSS